MNNRMSMHKHHHNCEEVRDESIPMKESTTEDLTPLGHVDRIDTQLSWALLQLSFATYLQNEIHGLHLLKYSLEESINPLVHLLI